MKYILFFLLWMNCVFSQTDLPLKLKDVAEKIKTSNLEVYDGATRVYNARQRIKFARASLLPKLNIWRLGSVIIDWKSAADVITQDLVPFLVPGNWQRVRQVKVFNEATNESFHGLTKNVIFHAKLQYFQLQQDLYQSSMQEDLLVLVNQMLKDISGQIYIRPELAAWVRDLNFQKTQIESDLLNFKQLIWEERQQLSIALGIETNSIILPEKISNFENSSDSEIQIDESNTDFINSSCELKEYDHLIRIAPSIKKEIEWNVLGVSEIARGAGNGVFDSVPIQDGFGFGMNSSLKIHKSQTELLKKQREGVVQILTRQNQSIQKNFQRIKESSLVIEERMKIVNQELDILKMQMTIGSPVHPIQLLNLQQKKILVGIESIANYFQEKIEIEKIKRLYGQEDYEFEKK